MPSTHRRFVASVETCVATWAAKPGGAGPHRLQAQLQHRFPWRSEPYVLALHLPPAADPPAQQGQPQQDQQGQGQQPGSALAWPLASGALMHDAPGRLQQWFGVTAFLLLTPDSYSGRVLEEEVSWGWGGGGGGAGVLRDGINKLWQVAHL